MKRKSQTTWCFAGTLSTRQAVARDAAGEVGGPQTLGTLARIMFTYYNFSFSKMHDFFFHFNFSEIRVHTITFGRDSPAAG